MVVIGEFGSIKYDLADKPLGMSEGLSVLDYLMQEDSR